jgi:hypothetical protein
VSKVQLKVNMIFGGAFYPRGAVMEAHQLPPNLRRQDEYVGEPGSVEPLYPSGESGLPASDDEPSGENDFLGGEEGTS